MRNLSDSYLSAFCAEFAALINAGITPDDCVTILLEDEPDKDGRTVLNTLVKTLNDGAPLSEALRASGYFPRYVIAMTEIGEKTGRLTDTLRALSAYYERQERMTKAIKSAVMYPSILFVMMTAVVVILITRVLPIFNDVFNRLGTTMSPTATRLMQFGGWLGNASAVIAAVFGIIIALALAAWLIAPIRSALSQMAGNIWGGRGVFGEIASSRYISAMSLGIASGLNVIDASEMPAEFGLSSVGEKQRRCIEMLHSGAALSEALRNSGILSARDSRLLSLSGRSGSSDTVMAEIADRSERRAYERIDALISRIEPTLVICASLMVGFILFSVMLPLMGIMSSLG